MAAGDVDGTVSNEKHSTLVPANDVLGRPQEATEHCLRVWSDASTARSFSSGCIAGKNQSCIFCRS
jgi:hypothetical protein